MNAVTTFESAAKGAQRGAGQATLVEQSRAIAEVQAAIVVAQNKPRSTTAAMAEMREVCRIPELAERAFFRFNRGGGAVSGESVHLARELARIWGNVTYGLAEMARDDGRGQSEMLAFAWDLQTNARSQTTFIVPHVRDTKGGSKPLTETRDIYENNANMGARRLREMIFAVLPVWFREEAAALCRKTLEDGGGKPLVQRIADCVGAFETIGVSRAQLAAKVGRQVDAFTAEDVATLGVVFKSIKRGEVQRDDEFLREELTAPAGADGFEAASAGQAAPAPRGTTAEQAAARETEGKTVSGEASSRDASTAEEAPANTEAQSDVASSSDQKQAAGTRGGKEAEITAGANAIIAELEAAQDPKAYFAVIDRPEVRKQREWLAQRRPELAEKIAAAVKEAGVRTGASAT